MREQPGTCTPFPSVEIWLILTRLGMHTKSSPYFAQRLLTRSSDDSVFARLSEDTEKLFLAFVKIFTLSYVNAQKLLTLWILNMYIYTYCKIRFGAK